MNNTNEPTTPSHAIWQVIGEKPKSKWMQIGVAFTNRDGSLYLKFDALPYIGRTMLRPIDGDGQA